MTPFRSLAMLGAAALAAMPSLARAADAVDIEAAKREGAVVWYSSTPIEQANKIVALFQAKYGIKVELFRSGGAQILRRFMQEHDAGRVGADVLTTSDPEAVADLAAKDVFVAFNPEGVEAIPANLRDPKGLYIGQRLNVVAFYGKSDILPVAQMPKSWADLARPEFKGKLVMTDPSFTVLQLYAVGTLSKALGWDYYEKLRLNDAMLVRGGQQSYDMVRRGERAFAGGTDISYAAAGKAQGFPLEIVMPSDGAFVIPAPTAIVKNGKNPNAAKLLAAFMISKEAQDVFPESGNYAARTDVAPPAGSPALKDMKVRDVDYEHVKKSGAAIKKRFSETFQ